MTQGISNERGFANESDLGLKELSEELKHELKMTKYGKFGTIFGAEENSSMILTFSLLLIILVMYFAICIISVWQTFVKIPAIEIFQILTSLITLTFGYFLGKKNQFLIHSILLYTEVQKRKQNTSRLLTIL